jgi:hypothetical protein
VSDPRTDEQKARREPFTPGRQIRLADGQEWTFPVAAADGYYPRRAADGTITWELCTSMGPTYDALVDRYVAAEDGVSQLNALLEMTWHLFQINYSLPFEAFARLIRRYPASHAKAAESSAVWTALREVALGEDPKLTPAGSSSPSEPTPSEPAA